MAIVDFIVSNYIVILIVVMIIVLALIGRYVEKTGFFDSVEKDKKNVNVPTQESVETTAKSENNVTPPEDIVFETPKETETVSIDDIDSALFAPIDSNNKYDEFNKEVKELLPKKEVIDDNLLSDIDNLSLDKTQKYNFGDIPYLDDVDLPKIKKVDENEDIWKF